MASRYAQWMYDWEHRLTSVDNNRVVRPLEWGVEWARDWPHRNGWRPGQIPDDPEKFFVEWNRRIVADSDTFYAYDRPDDYRLEHREVQVFSTREVLDLKLEAKVKGRSADFLRFTSPVRTPHPENDLANARWFPARGRRAVILLPHWNSDAIAYVSLCRVLNLLGIAVLRLSMPYHDIRKALEADIDLERLRRMWLAVSPMSYFDRFSRWPRKSLIIYAKYDLTFLPDLSRQVVDEFERRQLDHKIVVLPCGHYTMGEPPYKYMDGWQLASFLRTAFEN